MDRVIGRVFAAAWLLLLAPAAIALHSYQRQGVHLCMQVLLSVTVISPGLASLRCTPLSSSCLAGGMLLVHFRLASQSAR